MRIRKKRWAKPEMEKDHKVIYNPTELKGKWKDIFGNDNPIHLELGCGKGNFITKVAELNKNINYIAIDVYDEVLVYVLIKANENKLENIRIIPINIELLGNVFTQDEIEKIYINFCTPWPNRRHQKRRLTHPNFLRIYKNFLRLKSEVWFKTDDDLLFKDSLQYFKDEGFTEIYKTFDLHQSDYEDNTMTEYEEKFSSQGIKIKFGMFRHESTVSTKTSVCLFILVQIYLAKSF
ncbi:MAG: tRNA (guanosine(46)-N7)-methyltransferase TrmB [Desulfitobacterium hafniense]|nr:tRNA (guanosine(46)-N7)-methyltransferase TrmB [Desulfitobacterium hafniense]